jgi:hypothetical protein
VNKVHDAACQRCKTPIRVLPGTPAVCGSCARTRACKTFFATLMLITLLASLPLLLSSCNPIPGPDPKSEVTPTVPQETPIVVQHQPHIRIEAWLQDTSGFPRKNFKEAKQAIASSLDNLVQPDSDGAEVHIGLISSNSYDPASTVLSFTIPAIPADPLPPRLQPTVTASCQNIYTCAQQNNQILAQNAQVTAEYQKQLHSNHLQLARVRDQVRRFTDQLRSLNPPVDNGPTDMWGAFNRASQRLQGGKGPKYLIIAGSLENTTWQQFIPGDSLWYTKVRVVWHYCADAPACAANDDFWTGAFHHAGADDVRVFDVAQSETLSTVFV